MITNIKALSLELTPALNSYIREKISNLEKRLGDQADNSQINVEVGLITHHHKTGQIFRAEMNLVYRGKQLRTVAENEDMYLAVDGAKDLMMREVNKYDKRQKSIFRRGGRAIKNLFRGWRG
ncbi:MAG: Sigma 54 modulation protein/ribosomal protein S30EA [Parcubacteria group bacterium GW2011_GWC1_43_11b]|uniref:Ribosomal subunit interface protein n=2 Tax=Candidatus Vogeliibacteriota TaxID=1817922 RepID=A0A1G2QEL7_9BACT|nr:MAG: Sigma 54 modulation protein/ribosomal protein S30EA [Parcubacteria group bacterium GW2011_GWB1_42_9]KKS89509.1 MAG: Sigma 54 modulation protein/ribosomal protein S30EA [Parcubacteria group bacterium GW2011_GWC1_43_11b]KKT10136.1 MAG: Sigma 54 modulation protein/ribosomal protein S30EA [Parcubacteria group bacterium GW2011_GWA1_43_21]OHA59030.1 MAG: ribosomal subunit interface protein [Candidatus Vogelbacteria bacterium RIFOXYB1_FULL_42_16]OHA59373.1 MAG: ribosomal subunit interface prot